MHQHADERNQMQALDNSQAVDTRRGNPVDTDTQDSSLRHAKSRDMHQHAGDRSEMQPLDDALAVDTRRGKPVDTDIQDTCIT